MNASLNAARNCGRRVHIYAIEKNPYAVVDLHVTAAEWRSLRCFSPFVSDMSLLSRRWSDHVTIVPHDIRTWEAPEKADIIVSELLGSFGDNELSPECLDSAQRFLKVP